MATKQNNTKKKVLAEPVPEEVEERDDYVDILGTPTFKRTLTKTVIFFILVFISSAFVQREKSVETKLRTAYTALNVIGWYLSLLFLPNTSYKDKRVNFILKLGQAALFVYFINLIFLILFDEETTKIVLLSFDPKLADHSEERSYGADCRLYTPEHPDSKFNNLKEAMDGFVIAHLLGWAFNTVIFRNNVFLWSFSLLFEIYEQSFRHWLPNFYECWWDHLLLDVFGCNLLGIIIGNYVLKKFKIERFNWFFDPIEETEKAPYYKRFWVSLKHMDKYVETGKWHFLASPWKFFAVLFLFTATSFVNLSNFFNKTQLGIPPNQPVLSIRILFVGIAFICTVEDFYKMIRSKKRLKTVSFSLLLCCLIIACEFVLFIRNFKPHIYVNNTPLHVIYFWSGMSVLLICLLSFSLHNGKGLKKLKSVN